MQLGELVDTWLYVIFIIHVKNESYQITLKLLCNVVLIQVVLIH